MGTVIVNGIEYDTATGAAIETEDTNTVNKNLENKEIK